MEIVLQFNTTFASYIQSKPNYLDEPTKHKPNSRELLEKRCKIGKNLYQ